MQQETKNAFFDELTKLAAMPSIRSNARMPPRTKAHVEAFRNHIENWDSQHKTEALDYMQKVSPPALFDLLHSTRRWYTGQTMGNRLQALREHLQPVMKIEPEDVLGVYRGFKVPNDNPLAKLQVGEVLTLPVQRNRGLSSWSTSEAPTNRFSGGGKGKTGLIVKLVDTAGVTPILAPPSHTAPWFNALYEHAIGRSFRPTEGEYLLAAPEVKVEVVRVKR